MQKLNDRLREILRAPDGSFPKEANVATALGVQPTTVNQWLNGVEPCGQPHLARIVDEFFNGDASAKKSELRKLFLLLDQERVASEGGKKWTESAKRLAQEAIKEGLSESRTPRQPKSSGRTLKDFPDSFYPLTVVSGDKREESETRISIADFGAVSASPAESRWLLKIGLRQDVEFFGDKIFVLETFEQLKKRFADRNLLVLGSPGSNHFARILHLAIPRGEWRRGVPVFRFNLFQNFLNDTERDLDKLSQLNRKQLVGEQASPKTAELLKHQLRNLFAGGILDPAYHRIWKRATVIPGNRDFGLVTFARNPFSENDKHVCIMAAGFHMFGTAHALKWLSEPERFTTHPLGGVIRVDFDEGHEGRLFGEKFDNSRSEWDKDENRESGYSVDEILKGFELLNQDIRNGIRPDLQITNGEIDECVDFIRAL